MGVEPATAPGCPDVVALLSARLEGDVTADTCKQMEEHLAACPRCTGMCDSLRSTLKMCQRVGAAAPVAPEVQATVQQAVKDFLARHEAAEA
jgi:RNA polymerase sigma-70 factor (ECF subfamily)